MRFIKVSLYYTEDDLLDEVYLTFEDGTTDETIEAACQKELEKFIDDMTEDEFTEFSETYNNSYEDAKKFVKKHCSMTWEEENERMRT